LPLHASPEGSAPDDLALRCNPWKGHARAGPMSEANVLGLPCGLRLVPDHPGRSEFVIPGKGEH